MAKGRKYDRRTFIGAVSVVVILSLILYLAVQLSRNMSDNLSTIRTQKITDDSYVSLKGYIFRDEHTVVADRDVLVDSLVSNGEKVGVGKSFANVYTPNLSDSAELREVRERIALLTLHIEILEDSVGEDGSISNAGIISDRISLSYNSFVNSVADGNYSSADVEGENILGSINDYMIITGSLDKANSILSSLKQEKQALIDTYAFGEAQELITEDSCYFFRETDGYERVFDYSRVMTMTAEEFASLVGQAVRYDGLDVVGKKVYDPKWYVVLPADASVCADFSGTEGRAYEVVFSETKSISMELERICYAVDGSTDSFLVFSSSEMVAGYELPRTANLRIKTDTCTGYRVPSEAIVRGDSGDDGVFILSGNIVEYRRVSIIAERDGYCLVNTYEKDSSEENPSEVPYLNINDLIIISGSGLEDGKILK